MHPRRDPRAASPGAWLARFVLAAVLTAAASPLGGCSAAASAPPPRAAASAPAWEWNTSLPVTVTAVCAGSPDGPFAAGCEDGTLFVLEPSTSSPRPTANAGTSVIGVSAAHNGAVLAFLAPRDPGGLVTARLFDPTGRAVWETTASAPGWPLDGRLSQDGTSALIVRAGAGSAPAVISVRDAATGAVRWERQTPHAPFLTWDASADLRTIVAGYVVKTSDDATPTGLVEAICDGSLTWSTRSPLASFPSILATGQLVLAGSSGDLTSRSWDGRRPGAVRWRATGGYPGIVLARADRLLIATYQRETVGSRTTELTTITVYSPSGTVAFARGLRGTAPYLPTLSRDGRLLALIPRGPRAGEPPLLIRLDEPDRTIDLPADVTAIDFLDGDRALIGTAGNDCGVARLPR